MGNCPLMSTPDKKAKCDAECAWYLEKTKPFKCWLLYLLQTIASATSLQANR